MEIPEVPGLDEPAWSRWIAYRVAIKKPFKDVSLRAAAVKLSSYGEKQAEVVEQSIANQWTGLFDLKEPKKGEPKKKDQKQLQADEVHLKYLNRENQGAWEEYLASSPLARLHLAEALLARYALDENPTIFGDRMAWLKERVAAAIRDTPAPLILKDHRASLFVLKLFGKAGIQRLEQKKGAA